jgi:hypothetical protein
VRALPTKPVAPVIATRIGVETATVFQPKMSIGVSP